MLQRAFDFVNENPIICVFVMCLIGIAFIIIYAADGKNRRKTQRKIKRLKAAVETKEILIAQKDERIKKLQVELFALGMDKKISEEKLTKRIEKLETEKKQFLKWGSEK